MDERGKEKRRKNKESKRRAVRKSMSAFEYAAFLKIVTHALIYCQKEELL